MLLKRLWRVRRSQKPKARVLFVFDNPRRARYGSITVAADVCAALRERLTLAPPTADDILLIERLVDSGQAVYSLLYDLREAERIRALAEVEARKLLGIMLFDGTHPEDYITEATVGAERQRRTWRWGRSTPELLPHLRGERMCGPKRGDATRLVTVDLDRHSGAVAAGPFVDLVLGTQAVLSTRFPAFRFAPEINPRNGSTKFFGWADHLMPHAAAVDAAEQVRTVLAAELPGHDWGDVEIYPSTSPRRVACPVSGRVSRWGYSVSGEPAKGQVGAVN